MLSTPPAATISAFPLWISIAAKQIASAPDGQRQSIVMPGTSAERMLTGGPAAVAIAPAGYRNQDHAIKSVGVLVEDDGDRSAIETAKSLASALGVDVAERHTDADLIVVGSSPASPKGHVNLSARAGYAIEISNTPVIAVARGTEVKFSKKGIVRRVAEKV